MLIVDRITSIVLWSKIFREMLALPKHPLKENSHLGLCMQTKQVVMYNVPRRSESEVVRSYWKQSPSAFFSFRRHLMILWLLKIKERILMSILWNSISHIKYTALPYYQEAKMFKIEKCVERCPDNCPRGKLPPPPVEARARVGVGVGVRLEGQFFSGAIALKPF